MMAGGWAAWYSTWRPIELTPKSFVFPFLSFPFPFLSFPFLSFPFLSNGLGVQGSDRGLGAG